MAGIYVHIPFCKQACHYCDFHFSTSTKLKDQVLQAMETECEMRQDYLNESISTLYFGGGTPSILTAKEIEQLKNKFESIFSFIPGYEFTLEANPDDLNTEKLQTLKAAGVNRLSIGIQSFLDSQLIWMNRAHNSIEATECIETAHNLGFDNISIDLIYGLPNLTLDEWKAELQRAIDLGIQHISAYCLTVETNTALGNWVKKGKVKPMDEEAANIQFQIMIDTLAEAGFEQYEVSNFALPGFESKHNTAYWQGTPYLGLGPSAHSFDGVSRAWNVANNPKYVNQIAAGELPITTERLSHADKVNEYLMTALRTKWGVNFNRLKTDFKIDIQKDFQSKIDSLVERGLAHTSETKLVLTKKGLFFADGIASDFFILNHED